MHLHVVLSSANGTLGRVKVKSHQQDFQGAVPRRCSYRTSQRPGYPGLLSTQQRTWEGSQRTEKLTHGPWASPSVPRGACGPDVPEGGRVAGRVLAPSPGTCPRAPPRSVPRPGDTERHQVARRPSTVSCTFHWQRAVPGACVGRPRTDDHRHCVTTGCGSVPSNSA